MPWPLIYVSATATIAENTSCSSSDETLSAGILLPPAGSEDNLRASTDDELPEDGTSANVTLAELLTPPPPAIANPSNMPAPVSFGHRATRTLPTIPDHPKVTPQYGG